MIEIITDRQFEIIEAAGRILTESGVSGLTIKNLAKEMHFSEAAVYRHFSAKEDIIIAMLEYLATSMDERLSDAVSSDQSTIQKFVTLFESQFSYFDTNPHFVVAVFSDGLMEKAGLINKTIIKIMAVKTKHLAAIIEEGQQNGAFTNAISSIDLTQIVLGAFRMQMFKWRVSQFQYDIGATGGQMIQSILTLIKHK